LNICILINLKKYFKFIINIIFYYKKIYLIGKLNITIFLKKYKSFLRIKYKDYYIKSWGLLYIYKLTILYLKLVIGPFKIFYNFKIHIYLDVQSSLFLYIILFYYCI
jgi:hypothetical protein